MKAARRRNYHWLIAAAAFFCVAIAMGLENNLYSLYLIPVTQTLSASRGVFSSAQSVRCMAALVSNLLFGAVCRRFGVRRPLLVCAGLVALSYVQYAVARNVAPFFVGALVFGLGESFLNAAGMAHLAENWFVSRRGMVTGMIMAASGVGGAVLGVTLASVIARAGWRVSFLMGAGLMALAWMLVLLLVRDTPQELGLRPYEVHEQRRRKRPVAAGRDWQGLPLRKRLRQPCFYLAAGSILLCAICTYGAYPIVTAHLQDQGMSAGFAAAMFSLMMLLLALAKVGVGILSDRMGAARAMLLCMVCNVAGTFLLAEVSRPWQAVAMTLLMGVGLCSQTFLQPLLAPELFGRQDSATVSGILLAMVSAGGLIAPPLINFSYDRLGSYTPALLVLGVASILVTALFFAAWRMALRAKKTLLRMAEPGK